MGNKGNIRSMRFSDDVIKIIEDQPGDSFTAKFESLIYHCVQELPEKQKRVMMIQDLIEVESNRLDRIRKFIGELDSSMSRLSSNLQWYNTQAQQAVDSIDVLVKDCNTN